MGEPSGEGPGDDRERIRLALIEVVAARGYNSTSVEQVTERAGVDPGAFDAAYGDLEECFAEAWDQVDRELSRRMGAAFARQEDWQDRLREALQAGLRYMAADENRARLYVAEVVYVSEPMRDRQREALTRLGRLIDAGREGAPKAMNVTPSIAEAVSGAVWRRAHQLVQTGRAKDLPGEISRFMYIAVLPYRGAAAAEAELGRS